jgi:hypothetical protein
MPWRVLTPRPLQSWWAQLYTLPPQGGVGRPHSWPEKGLHGREACFRGAASVGAIACSPGMSSYSPPKQSLAIGRSSCASMVRVVHFGEHLHWMLKG